MGSGQNVVKILTFFVTSPVILALVFVPLKAEAGVFSFISSLFSSVSAETEEIEPNSQNMALLQAIISPDQGATSTKNEIVIVGGTSLSPEIQAPIETKTLSEDQISIYVVRSGDTLPAIAKMFDVSVNTIRWANNLKSNTITPGQTLVILPISGVQHIVKSGDTLISIAKQYKGDLDEILQYNNMAKDEKLAIGDIIFIPDGELTAVVSRPNTGGGKTSQPTYAGFYMRPIVGGVKSQGIHGHNGVDLASVYGANILASADGQVIVSRSSGWNGGYGLYIVVKHSNGTQTLYAHLSKVLVSVGDNVTQGQVIGKMGSTGRSTGVHVHFEIRGARNPF